jgi:hypothetical protein
MFNVYGWAFSRQIRSALETIVLDGFLQDVSMD